MCIAIYSMKGNDIPCEDYLKTSFENNDDGAGFAFNTDDHRVRIVKGLMTWESFKNTFYQYDKQFDFKNRGVLIHFRITTHGGTRPECCHPFPVVGDIGMMQKLECTTNWACIHNGIITLTSAEATKRQTVSDTMVFVEKYLSKLATNKGWFKNTTNYELLYDMLDSKMAILNGNGDINSTYGFVQDADGNFYSNTSYKVSRIPYVYTSRAWDDDWDGTYMGASSYYGSGVKRWIPLQRLDQNQMIYFDDETIVEYDPADEIRFLATKNGEIFMVCANELNGWYPNATAIYCGTGTILDSLYRLVPFTRDVYIREDRLDMEDYEYALCDEADGDEKKSDKEVKEVETK